jgi:hypothetical protein
MALINFSFRRSAREFWRDTTAQTAAGIQPIKVTWRIKQIIPEKIFPRNMKDNHGNKMASNNIYLSLTVIRKRNFGCILMKLLFPRKCCFKKYCTTSVAPNI